LANVLKAAGQTLQQFLVKRIPRWSQRVVAPQAGLADYDQACAAEVGQVAGRLRLLDLKGIHNIADARLAAIKQ